MRQHGESQLGGRINRISPRETQARSQMNLMNNAQKRSLFGFAQTPLSGTFGGGPSQIVLEQNSIFSQISGIDNRDAKMSSQMVHVPEGRQRNAANAMNNSLFSSQQNMQD